MNDKKMLEKLVKIFFRFLMKEGIYHTGSFRYGGESGMKTLVNHLYSTSPRTTAERYHALFSAAVSSDNRSIEVKWYKIANKITASWEK